MSKDIRSFFSVGGKKPAFVAKKVTPPAKKTVCMQISSSDEEVANTPEVVSKKRIKTVSNKKSNKRRIVDSDEEEEVPIKNIKPKTPESKKEVDPKQVFGNKAIVRIPKKVPPPKKTLLEQEIEIHSDEELEKTLLALETSVLMNDFSEIEKKKTPIKKTPEKIKEERNRTPVKKTPIKEEPKKKKTPIKEEPKKKKTPIKEETKKKTPVKIKEEPKKVRTPSGSAKKPKPKTELNESSQTDEERHEKKILTAILYQKYKNRGGAINPGSKEIPKGKPNCLSGLTFLVTGLMESIEREECNELIKNLGGKLITGVTKKLNYLVIGEESGPAKLAKAEELGTTILNEDDLFNLIREKSGIKVEQKSNGSEKRRKSSDGTDEDLQPKLKKERKESPKKENSDDGYVTIVVKKKEVVSPKKEIKAAVVQPAVDNCMLAWVDKYKPTTIKSIIGQQGPTSNCEKLQKWLSKWHSNHDGKKKLQKPNPWAKNDDGAYYKAVLLSGPPGVGKTTTATLVCKELGFDTSEFNASDTRSKKLLKVEVSELLSNKSLYGYFHGAEKGISSKHVLIMDEVDGMAGNEDRGGIQELISLIKESSIPIICMCNDRNHQKMRSLVNHCYDLRFAKPRIEQIKGAMLSICHREKMKITPKEMDELISATNNDIRQTLNHLSLMSADKDIVGKKDEVNKTAQKDMKMGPWDVVRKVFSVEEHKTMSIHDKSDLFFHDYSLAPLFVQQNYLSVAPKVPKNQVIQQVALAADSLSRGDMVDKRIRSQMAWSLLPVQAFFSSVLPGEYMEGSFTGQINFPGWLGKNSRASKRSRLAQEIHDHTRIRTSGSRLSVRLDYAPFIINAICRPLKEKGLGGVEEALNVIKEYRLLREDIESMIELTSWPGKKSPMDAVESKVKAALTRAYNKEVTAYVYSATAGIKKKKHSVDDSGEDGMNGEEGDENCGGSSADEDDDNLDNDALIKAKKPVVKKAAAGGRAKAATSKDGTKSKKK